MMSNDYYRGYAAGCMSRQPEWISVKDRLPECDGHYYTIKETRKGFPGYPIGTISVDTCEEWKRGKWQQDDKYWKVLYWAKPIQIIVPEELARRYRIGA